MWMSAERAHRIPTYRPLMDQTSRRMAFTALPYPLAQVWSTNPLVQWTRKSATRVVGSSLYGSRNPAGHAGLADIMTNVKGAAVADFKIPGRRLLFSGL